MGANETQVGGTHYADGGEYQHWDSMADMFGYMWFVGCASKYAMRHTKKHGKQDLLKAAHYLEKLAELSDRHAGLYTLAPTHEAAYAIAHRFIESNAVPEDDHDMVEFIYTIRDPGTAKAALALVQEAIAYWYPEAPDTDEEKPAAADAPLKPLLPWQRELNGDTQAMLKAAHEIGNEVGDFLMEVSAFLGNEGAALQAALNEGLAAAQALPEGSEEAAAAQKAAIDKATDEDAAVREAFRWLSISKTDLQRGFMAVKRAIGRPKGF